MRLHVTTLSREWELVTIGDGPASIKVEGGHKRRTSGTTPNKSKPRISFTITLAVASRIALRIASEMMPLEENNDATVTMIATTGGTTRTLPAKIRDTAREMAVHTHCSCPRSQICLSTFRSPRLGRRQPDGFQRSQAGSFHPPTPSPISFPHLLSSSPSLISAHLHQPSFFFSPLSPLSPNKVTCAFIRF